MLTTKNRTKSVSIHFNEAELRELDALADAMRISSRPALIRAIIHYAYTKFYTAPPVRKPNAKSKIWLKPLPSPKPKPKP